MAPAPLYPVPTCAGYRDHGHARQLRLQLVWQGRQRVAYMDRLGLRSFCAGEASGLRTHAHFTREPMPVWL